MLTDLYEFTMAHSFVSTFKEEIDACGVGISDRLERLQQRVKHRIIEKELGES